MKRLLRILLFCALLLCLTACETSDEKENNEGNPAVSGQDNIKDGERTGQRMDSGDAEGNAPDGGLDYDAAYRTFAADEIVMTVNGEEITWQEYYRWLYYVIAHMEECGEITDWDAQCTLNPEYTNAEYAEQYAQSTVTQYHVIDQTAEARKVVLTEEEEDAISDTWQEYVELFREEEEILSHLDTVYITKEQYLFEQKISALYDGLFAARYGADGSKCTDRQVAAFAEENSYIRVKYLLLSTVDADEMLLEETEIQRKKEQIAAFYEQIIAAENSEAEFEVLCDEYNEDIRVAQFPDGYTWSLDTTPNVELRDAIAAIPEYGISEPVQGGYGFYILYRLPLDYDGIVEYDSNSEAVYTLRYITATELFHNEIAELLAAADVTCSEELENLDLETLFVRK